MCFQSTQPEVGAADSVPRAFIMISLTHSQGRGSQDDLQEYYLQAFELKPCIIHFICVFSELFETAPHFFLWMYPALLHFWGTCEGGGFHSRNQAFQPSLQACKGGAEISHTYHMTEQLSDAAFIRAYIIFQTLGFH